MFRRKKQPVLQAPDFLIVGLGNPGARYEMTRHNCGFLAVDLLAQRAGLKRLTQVRCKALTGACTLEGRSVLLAKPQTYMNLSGQAVRELMASLSLPPERLVVVYDDCDLAPGRMRIRIGGSAGTHNGMRDILAQLGADVFPRVRIGIGRPPAGEELADYVLSPLDNDTWDCIRRAPDALCDLLANGAEHAMQTYNQKRSE